MRETVFVGKNEQRWQSYEHRVVSMEESTPEELAEAYVALTEDLAYAQVQYPDRTVTRYLNQLVGRVHLVLMRTQSQRWDSIKGFFASVLPNALAGIRFEMRIVLVLLLFTVGIGYISTIKSDSVARIILGDQYVDMTIANIMSGDPMGVYKSESWNMFFRIAANNLLVMLRVTALGSLPLVGIAYVTVYHGVMIGSFHALFTRYGELERSLLTVWIHGTTEIAMLVVSCSAGLSIGMAILNPDTFSRIDAFKASARRAAIIAFGIIPVIVFAAALESFVTRHTDMPLTVNLLIIVATGLAMFWYFWKFPIEVMRRTAHANHFYKPAAKS
jgi:uncharacterized membrane protein SpoIIM required for sporulation